MIISTHYATRHATRNKKSTEFIGTLVMPAAGLEPARGCPQQILSLPRLPFRHAGISLRNIKYITI